MSNPKFFTKRFSESLNAIALDPCPFCSDGSPRIEVSAIGRGDSIRYQAYAECLHCEATGPDCVFLDHNEAAKEAAESWNQRGAPR